MTSRYSSWSRSSAGSRNAVWTTAFGSRWMSMIWPISRPLGYGERMPSASSMPAVSTSSPIRDALRRVDVAHHQDAAELADDLAGRAVRRGRGPTTVDSVSVISADPREVRPDLDDPPGERPAGRDHDVADLDAASVPWSIVIRRRNSDDSRAMTCAATVSNVSAAAQLEERGQRLVLAAELDQARVLGGEPLVLRDAAAGCASRSWSISVIASTIEAAPRPTSANAACTGRNAKASAALDLAHDRASTRTP